MRALLLCSALILSACTQKAVEVVSRGGEDFSGGKHQYASASPKRYNDYAPAAGGAHASAPAYSNVTVSAPRGVDQSTSSTVRVESVGVSDLPPPAAAPAKKPARSAYDERTELVPSSSGFVWPVKGKVTEHFGPKGAGQASDGIRIASSKGESVRASADGVAVYVGEDLKHYGRMVIVKHASGMYSTYAELSEIGVSRFENVKSGQVIGKSGKDTYFAMRKGATPVNPEQYLPSDYAALR